ncbi:YdcF family protein [Sulfobacillus harzensis]|nr:YdcF family protein [Sulfobacillus harzensis]
MIVILGGADLRARTDFGAHLFHDNLKALVLISGTPQETSTMTRWLTAHGVPDSRQMREAQSYSTWDNARHVGVLLRTMAADTVAVVTSSWHAPRAHAMFARVLRGNEVRLRFCPVPSRTTPWIALLEVLKTTVWLVHRI